MPDPTPQAGAPSASSPTRQPFTLYAARGRVYASNVRQKLIDLGSLAERNGSFGYEIDGNHHVGQGFKSAEEALAHLAGQLRFLYLDGQFTALADVRGPEGPNLDEAAQLDITLDELGEGEAAVDVSV